MEGQITANRRRVWEILQTAGVLLWFVAMIFQAYSPERGGLLIRCVVMPALFALAGARLFASGAKGFAARCMLLFAGWFVVTRALNGDHYLSNGYDSVSLTACACAVALPLGLNKDAAARARAMRATALTLTLVMGALAWLAVGSAVTRQEILLPGAETVIGVDSVFSGIPRLNLLGIHPNTAAALLNIALGMALWLMLTAKRKLWLIPLALIAIGLYAAVALTDSRTAMIVTALMLAGLCYLLAAQWLRQKPALARTLIALAAAALIAVGAYFGFSLANDAISAFPGARAEAAEQAEAPLISERPLTENLLDWSGRLTVVYPKAIEVLKERPIALAIGTAEHQTTKALSRLAGERFYHWHNSFLEVLISTGVPGLLLALAFSALLIARCGKLFFAPNAPLAAKMLVLTVAGLFLHGMLEAYLFIHGGTCTMLFMLLSGLALGYAEELCPTR